jgi:chemotaxis protein CheX
MKKRASKLVRIAELKLKPVLDLTAAAPLKAEFQGLRGQHVRLDASEVDRLGALCLQVLMAARSTWAQDGAVLTLGSTSPAFDEAVATLGASSFVSAMSRE